MEFGPVSPATAVWFITLFSIHVTTATVATFFLAIKRAPVPIVNATLVAWFIPLLGPLLTMIHTGRIRDWTDDEVNQWLYEQRMAERVARAEKPAGQAPLTGDGATVA